MIQPGELKVGARAYLVRGAQEEWHAVEVRVVSFDDEIACVHGPIGVNHHYDGVPGRRVGICFAELEDLFLDVAGATKEVRERIEQGQKDARMITRAYENAGTDGVDL